MITIYTMEYTCIGTTEMIKHLKKIPENDHNTCNSTNLNCIMWHQIINALINQDIISWEKKDMVLICIWNKNDM